MKISIDSIMEKRFFVLVIALSLMGVLGLYAYAMFSVPGEVPLGEIDGEYIGQSLSTRGIVRELRASSALNMELIDAEGNGPLTVFAPIEVYDSLEFKSRLVPGAGVGVKGEVKSYEGQLEIYVRSDKGIELISDAAELKLDLSLLSSRPSAFGDLEVAVEGAVTRIEPFKDYEGRSGTGMTIRDGAYSLDCILYGNAGNETPGMGSKVVVRGIFHYDDHAFRYVLINGG